MLNFYATEKPHHSCEQLITQLQNQLMMFHESTTSDVAQRRKSRRILQKKEGLFDYYNRCRNDSNAEMASKNILTTSVLTPRIINPSTASSNLSNYNVSSPLPRLKMWTKRCLSGCLSRSQHSRLLLLGTLCTLLSFTCNVQGLSQPPGFIDFDNLPMTTFSCEGKVIGGYYADVETGCQMFHVCTLGQKDEIQDIKFLCLNGTVFDQETRVCERVEEVDCSKAERFYDLNLELYAHIATTKPPDLEEEDAIIRPIASQTTKPTVPPPPPRTTTIRTTTTQAPVKPPPVRQRTRLSQSSDVTSETTKPPPGYSSFNYYLKTPHSHVASGYNSQSRQSYVFNHNPSKSGSSSAENTNSLNSESTGRKIPSGPKTIIYAVSSSSTAKPQTTPPSNYRLEDDEEYEDEYYDDLLDYEDIPSSTSSVSRPSAGDLVRQRTYGAIQQRRNNNQYNRGTPSRPSSFEYRDGRSTSLPRGRDIGGKGGSSSRNQVKSHVSVAVSSSSSRSSRTRPVIIRTTFKPRVKSTVKTTTTTTTTPAPRYYPVNSTEVAYYYDDDYVEEQIPAVIVRGSSKQRPPTKLTEVSSDKGKTVRPPLTRNSEDDEYYDDESEDGVNINQHHFSHFDVPRIPYAKPNVPRVLVTNGKPFLPRLTRHVSQEDFHKRLHPVPEFKWPGKVFDDVLRKK